MHLVPLFVRSLAVQMKLGCCVKAVRLNGSSVPRTRRGSTSTKPPRVGTPQLAFAGDFWSCPRRTHKTVFDAQASIRRTSQYSSYTRARIAEPGLAADPPRSSVRAGFEGHGRSLLNSRRDARFWASRQPCESPARDSEASVALTSVCHGARRGYGSQTEASGPRSRGLGSANSHRSRPSHPSSGLGSIAATLHYSKGRSPERRGGIRMTSPTRTLRSQPKSIEPRRGSGASGCFMR